MYIDRGGRKGLVSHESLNGHKIDTILVKMSAECVTERMTCQTPGPPEFLFMGSDVSGKEKGIDRLGRICLFWKEPSGGSSAFKPVLCKDIEGIL